MRLKVEPTPTMLETMICAPCAAAIDWEIARPSPQRTRAEDLQALTPREIEMLDLVAAGLSNQEIADRLVLSSETVKTHVSHVFRKLGLRDRAQVVVAAYEFGLVAPGA